MNKLLICCLVITLTGCTSQRMVHHDRPDIKNDISISHGVAFDVRILQDVYGKPQIVDLNGNALVYSNVYEFKEGINPFWFFGLKSSGWSEAWYLVLHPANENHYYTAERYMYKRKADLDEDGQVEFKDPDLWTSANDIEKYCRKKTE